MISRKLFFIISILFTQLNYGKIPGLDELTERERVKLKCGLMISYIIANIEAIKTYNKTTNTYDVSKASHLLIAALSLLITFKREDEKGWNYTEFGDLRKIAKNGLCTAAGAGLGLIIPPLIQIPYFLRKINEIIG